MSSFEIVACRPQGNNEICSFANDVCETTCEVEKIIDRWTFTSFATDVVSLDYLDAATNSSNFWRVNTKYNAGTDAKHNVKKNCCN